MSSLGGSLWLVPDPTSRCAQSLRAQIQKLSDDSNWGVSVAKAFSPHMTITSGITDYFLSSAPKVEYPGYAFIHLNEINVRPPVLKVKEVVFGDLFLYGIHRSLSVGVELIDTSKRIFLRLERTESLLEVVKTLRSEFVGESVDGLDEFMDSFDPHISLAYAEGFTESENQHAQLRRSIETCAKDLDLSSFQFIVLMDTRSPVSRARQDLVNDWKASPIRLAL